MLFKNIALPIAFAACFVATIVCAVLFVLAVLAPASLRVIIALLLSTLLCCAADVVLFVAINLLTCSVGEDAAFRTVAPPQTTDPILSDI